MLVTAVTIVVTLLLCPAATRVLHVQPLSSPGPTSYAPSFQKSLDVPPDRAQIACRDVTVVPVPLENLTTFVITHWPRPTDDALTWSFLGLRTRPLRAPPVRLA